MRGNNSFKTMEFDDIGVCKNATSDDIVFKNYVNELNLGFGNIECKVIDDSMIIVKGDDDVEVISMSYPDTVANTPKPKIIKNTGYENYKNNKTIGRIKSDIINTSGYNKPNIVTPVEKPKMGLIRSVASDIPVVANKVKNGLSAIGRVMPKNVKIAAGVTIGVLGASRLLSQTKDKV